MPAICGNNKSREEIEFALKEKIGTMMVDSEYELDLIEQIAESLNTKVGIILRVTPGIDTHTHKYIQTGQVDSKFGISIDRIPGFIKKILSKEPISFNGLHFHLGSQIFDLSSYVLAIKEMVKLMRKIKDLEGVDTLNLNLGGGLGVKYLESDLPPSTEYFVNLIVPRPAVVLVNQGKDDVIVKKETYTDIVRNDTIPERFK